MEIIFLPKADEDFLYWKQKNENRILKQIRTFLADIQEHPFTGIGKPEPLKGNLRGLWSRHITDEHRLVCSISSGRTYVYVFSLRYHYSKYKYDHRISYPASAAI